MKSDFGVTKVIRTSIQQARIYQARQEWKSAAIACQQILKINPDIAEAYQILGNSLQNLDGRDMAIKSYLKAIAIEPNAPEVFANLGKLYAKNAQWQQALQSYEQCLALAPGFVSVYRSLAKIWERLGDAERAWFYVLQALELEPQSMTAQQHLNLASKLESDGELDKALIFYRYALKQDQNLTLAETKIAKISQQLRQTESEVKIESAGGLKGFQSHTDNVFKTKAAQSQLATATESKQQTSSQSSLAVTEIKLGNLALQQKQWEQGIEHYRQAIKLAPQSAIAHLNLGKIYQYLGREQEAAIAYFQGSKLDPKQLTPQQHLDLGQKLLDLKLLEQAEVSCRQALSQGLIAGYLTLGKVQEAKPNIVAAEDCYQQLLKHDRQNIDALINLAALKETQGDRQAEDYYHQALETESASGESYHRLGDILSKREDWQGAIRAYHQAIACEPEFSWSYHNLGDAYLKIDRLIEGIKAYQKAIILKPDFFWSYQNLGEALFKQERWSEAIEAYQQAIALDSSFHWSYYNLGECLSKLFRWQEAIAAYRQAIELKPDFAEAYAHLADALIREEDWDGGIENYERAIELDPGIDIAVYRSLKEALDRRKYLTQTVINAAPKPVWPFEPVKVYPPFPTLPDGSPLPKISIVTPSYNQGEFIEETILSVIHQDYPNLEYILIDGASADNTMEMVEKYRQHFSYVVSETDKGQSNAINKGFERATGEIFTWLNSDDCLAPGALHAMALAFYRSGADAVAGICQIFQDGREIEQHLTSCANGVIPLEDILDLENCWLQGKFFYQPEVMFTRDIWSRAGGEVKEDLYYSMDYEMWARFAACGAKLQVIGYPIAQYRLHEEQKTSTMEKYRPELLQVRESLRQRFKIAATEKTTLQRKRLKIVVLNDTGFLGGAGIAHQRLARALQLAGHQVYPLAGTLDWSLTPIKCTAAEVESILDSLDPDLLLVGNIHNFLSSLDILESLSAKYPTVFAMHDQWLLTGRCGYTGDCTKYTVLCDADCPTWDKYPCLAPSKIAPAFNRKQALLKKEELLVLGDSEWLTDWARQTYEQRLGAKYSQFAAFHYGLDTQTFSPQDQIAARHQLGLPEDKFIILTGSQSLEDERKGFKHLLAALEIANLENVLLLCFGHDFQLDTTVEIESAGYINSPEILAHYYNAADLFISPALEEAFGQTFIEAAACGTPAVGFAVGGITEAISDRISGRLVLSKSSKALAKMITELYTDPAQLKLLSQLAPWYAASNFSFAASYHSIIAAWSNTGYLARLGMNAVTKFRVDSPAANSFLTVKGGNPQIAAASGKLPLTIPMDNSLQGSGWYSTERVNGVMVRWMQKVGTVVVPPLKPQPLELELKGIGATDLQLLAIIQIKVNGSLIQTTIEHLADGAWICRGRMAAAVVPARVSFLIAIEVAKTIQFSAEDFRQGSLLVESLVIRAS